MVGDGGNKLGELWTTGNPGRREGTMQWQWGTMAMAVEDLGRMQGIGLGDSRIGVGRWCL